MGFKTALKRFFGSHEKKDNEPAVEDTVSVNSADNCEICRARAAEARGGRDSEPHYKKSASKPAHSEPAAAGGSKPSPDSSLAFRGRDEPKPDYYGQVPQASAARSDTKDPVGARREQDKGVAQEFSDRSPAARYRDLHHDPDVTPSTKDRLDTLPRGRDDGKQSATGKSHPSAPESRFYEPGSDIDKGRRTGIDIPPGEVTKQSREGNQQLSSRHDIPTNDQPPSQHIDDHDKGFVGLGRTPGPSTTLMSDTKNGKEPNPFDFGHGAPKLEEARADTGRLPDTPGRKLNSNAPEFVPGTKNPFRHPETSGTAHKEGTTTQKDSAVPRGLAASGVLGAGAGAYAAHELGRDHPGYGHKGEDATHDNSATKGAPGGVDVNRTQTPVSLAEHSRDRLGPPSPPLSEKERSREVEIRDEMDSQKFDGREATPVGREHEREREGSKLGEAAAVGGGVGAGAAVAGGAAARSHEKRDQASGEGRTANGSNVPKSGQAKDTAPELETQKLDKDEDIGAFASCEPVAGTSDRGRGQSSRGLQGTGAPRDAGAGELAPPHAGGHRAGLAQESTDTDTARKAAPFDAGSDSAAGVAAGSGARAAGAANNHPDKKDMKAAGVQQPTAGMAAQPLKLNNEDVSTDDKGISGHSVSTNRNTVPSSDVDHPFGAVRGGNPGYRDLDSANPKYGTGDTTGPHASSAMATQAHDIDGAQSARGTGGRGKAAAGVGLAAGATAAAGTGAALTGRKSSNRPEGDPNSGQIDVPQLGASPAKDSEDLAIPGVNKPARDNGLGNTYGSSHHHPNQLLAGADQKSCPPAVAFQDQFDERGTCFGSVNPPTSCPEEELFEEDDHGMIPCHQALAASRASPNAARNIIQARSAATVTAGVAALGAGVAATSSSAGKRPLSSAPSQLYTIPGTAIPVTPTDEGNSTVSTSGIGVFSNGHDHGEENAPTSTASRHADEADIDDVMAPSSVGGLTAPTATVAAQSAPEEQSSRVRDAAERPDQTNNKAQPGRASPGIAAGIAGATALLAGALGLDIRREDAGESSPHARAAAEPTSTHPNMSQTQASEPSPRGDDASLSPSTPRPAGHRNRPDEIGTSTPSDEDAWTRLPPEQKPPEGIVRPQAVPADSESQYSEESLIAHPGSRGKVSSTERVPRENTIAGADTGLLSTGAAATLSSHIKSQGAREAPEPESPRYIPGTSWTGDDEIRSTPISPGVADAKTPSAMAPRSEHSLPSEDESVRASRHSEAMPGDWNLETTEEGLGDTSTHTGAKEHIFPTTRPEDSKINRELDRVANVGGGPGLLSGGISDVIRRESTTGGDTSVNAAPSTKQSSKGSSEVDRGDVVARDFARQRQSEDLPSPTAGPQAHEPATLATGRSDITSTRAFEEALASNEHQNMLRTPRFTDDVPSPLGEGQTHGTNHPAEKEVAGAGGLAAGTAGLGQRRGSETLSPHVGPRSGSTGVATIEEPYIYKRPTSLTDRIFPESAVREETSGPLANAVPVGTGKRPAENLGTKHLSSDEEDLQDVESDYETEEDEEPLLLRDDLAEAAPIFPSMQHGDPVLDKEVVDHQEHYTGVLAHDLT